MTMVNHQAMVSVVQGRLSRVSGVTPIVWLLRDEFLTDEAAPLASPRTAEPGPGTATITGGDTAISILGGRLKYVGGTAIVTYSGIARAAGVAMSAVVRENVYRLNVEFDVRLYFGLGATLFVDGSTVPVGTYSVGIDYHVTSVLFASGSALFIQGGAFTEQTLLWVHSSGTTNPISPRFYGGSGGSSNSEVDYVRVRQLPAPFDSDYGIASVNQATPTSGTSYTATADAITDMAITLPGSPSSGDRMELRYRVQDDDNYMVFYARHSGSAWDVRIDKVEGGSATQLLNVTNVGTPDTLRVITDGNLHDAYTKSGTTWTKCNGQINNSFNAALTTIKPVFEVGSVGSLRSYPRTSPAYAELDRI